MNYDFSKSKEDALTKPRDLCWDNWAKFGKTGDSVQGFIRDVFFRAATGVFGDQRGITLEQPDGKGLINVGIKHIDFVLKQTDGLRLGDPLTIVFEKETPNKDTSLNDIKVMGFYGKNMPENAGEMTVAELEAEDRGKVDAELAASKKKSDEEFDAAETKQETPATAEGTPEPVETPAATSTEAPQGLASNEAPKI